MHPEQQHSPDEQTPGSQPLGADVRISADPDPDPDLDVTPTREPGVGEPAEDPDPPVAE